MLRIGPTRALLLVLLPAIGLGAIGRAQEGKARPPALFAASHALVVGISRYRNLPKDRQLSYADRDAAAIREILIRSYGFPGRNVLLLQNEQASKRAIEEALANLTDDQRVGKEDRVLVFFAGHGQTVKLANGGEMGFLIPSDADVDLSQPENRGPYLRSCVPMELLWRYLELSPAKHRLLIADACYGGLLAQSRALATRTVDAAAAASLAARPALQVLTAGGKDEVAFEDPKLGHGAFTYKLLEELKARAATADQIFLISDLAAALKRGVSTLTGGKQNPQFGARGDGEGEFLFRSEQSRDVGAPEPETEQVRMIDPLQRRGATLDRATTPPPKYYCVDLKSVGNVPPNLAADPDWPDGRVSLGGLPFQLGKHWICHDQFLRTAFPRVLTLDLNLAGIREVHTLLSAWGGGGRTMNAEIRLIGSGGAVHRFPLVANRNIREIARAGAMDGLADPDSWSVFEGYNTQLRFAYSLDKQRFDVPATLAGGLRQVAIVDMGGPNTQRLTLGGMTLCTERTDRRPLPPLRSRALPRPPTSG